jgi:hypothetical protein
MLRTLRRALPFVLPTLLGCGVDASGLGGADLGDGSFDGSDDTTVIDAPPDVADDTQADATLDTAVPEGSLFETGAPCLDPKTDCPAPGACSEAICSGGFCGTKPLASRTPCTSGGGHVCDGAGACIACVVDGDCPGAPNVACSSSTCVAATCADKKKDGTETDVDCGGSCAKCGLGKACVGASDCASNKCVGAKCVCATDAQCGTGKYCDATSACKVQLTQGKACTRPGECTTGFCVDGFCCNTACTGTCQACSGALRGGGAANDGTCGAVKDNTDPKLTCTASPPCGNTGICQAGACKKTAAGTVCASAGCSGGSAVSQRTCDGAGTCSTATTTNCAPYTCDLSGKCKTTCVLQVDCDASCYCATGGVCTAKKLTGTTCGAALECASGNCVDGVCCDSACVGACRACDVVGSTGTCTMLTAGTEDPAASCTTTLACDGKGNCLAATGQPCSLGTQCASGTCNLSGGSGNGKCT